MSRTHEKRTNKTEASEIAMTTALEVANFFLSMPDDDSGDLVSNLKLQKLLYYAQGYYLGLHGASKPLFDDTIFAWKHGPVVQTVYKHFSPFRNGAIPKAKRPKNLDADVVAFLEEIYRTFGRFSAWALREMSHREGPWLQTYRPSVRNIEIPVSDMAAFFKGKISRVHKKA